MKQASRYWFFSGAVCITLVPIFLLLWQHYPGLAAENGLLENFQGSLYVLGWLWVAVTLMITHDIKRFSGWFYSLFMVSMLLREIDMDRIGLPDMIVFVTSGVGRDLILGVSWLVILFLAIRHFRQAREEIVSALRSVWGRHLLVGVLFYLGGESFDKHLYPFSRETTLFCEEMLEALGAFMFMYSTILWSFLGTIRKQRS
jgi:hypothetical protein